MKERYYEIKNIFGRNHGSSIIINWTGKYIRLRYNRNADCPGDSARLGLGGCSNHLCDAGYCTCNYNAGYRTCRSDDGHCACSHHNYRKSTDSPGRYKVNRCTALRGGLLCQRCNCKKPCRSDTSHFFGCQVESRL